MTSRDPEGRPPAAGALAQRRRRSSPALAAKDAVARAVTTVHRAVLGATGGRLLGRLGGMPVVVLLTTGRRSGRRRATVLTSPVQCGERIVLVASYGGDDRHPAWFLNVRENADVEVIVGGRRRRMRARVATLEERQRLWPDVVRRHGGYERYQERSSREIPLVIVEPAPPSLRARGSGRTIRRPAPRRE